MTRIGAGRSTETRRAKEKRRSAVDTRAKTAKIASPRNLAASFFDHAEPIETVNLVMLRSIKTYKTKQTTIFIINSPNMKRS